MLSLVLRRGQGGAGDGDGAGASAEIGDGAVAVAGADAGDGAGIVAGADVGGGAGAVARADVGDGDGGGNGAGLHGLGCRFLDWSCRPKGLCTVKEFMLQLRYAISLPYLTKEFQLYLAW